MLKVTGCVAVLSHFISRLWEKVLPLYQLLKKTKRFVSVFYPSGVTPMSKTCVRVPFPRW